MKINLQELRESLNEEHIIQILLALGADRYEDKGETIIFPTICHNPRDQEASMKLYYYKNSHMFHCYTECSENFDIFDLIKRVREVNREEYNFYQTVYSIADLVSFNIFSEDTQEKYISNVETTSDEIILQEYDSTVMELFPFYRTVEWAREGITEESMRKFNIRYYIYQNKIVIPHYDIDGRLVGIRGRTLEPDEVERYGKYMPLKVENVLYRHPLSFNLYGIYENKKDIQEYKTAIIFEGEKSVLKFNDMYDYNIAVASCGSSLNYKQVELLVKDLGVQDIIIAYDKEFDNFASEAARNYYTKLNKLCTKYANYCNFYFLFDYKNLLETKDSPIDKGKEIFEQMLQNKVRVRNDL